jgi:uncharacterized phage protein (TIGR01671 family)
MKEIKFRAWNKQRRIMIYNVFVENNDNDGFVTFWDDDFSMFEKNYLPFSDVDVMQYTGLRDKNGIEIYEGDIIEAYFYYDGDDDKKDPSNKKIFDVKYKIDKGRQFSGFDFFPSVFEHVKVIGNIYENPELMKGE